MSVAITLSRYDHNPLPAIEYAIARCHQDPSGAALRDIVDQLAERFPNLVHENREIRESMIRECRTDRTINAHAHRDELQNLSRLGLLGAEDLQRINAFHERAMAREMETNSLSDSIDAYMSAARDFLTARDNVAKSESNVERRDPLVSGLTEKIVLFSNAALNGLADLSLSAGKVREDGERSLAHLMESAGLELPDRLQSHRTTRIDTPGIDDLKSNKVGITQIADYPCLNGPSGEDLILAFIRDLLNKKTTKMARDMWQRN